jgi:hypothetical protein
MTGVESCAGGETDVITFYADSSLPEPFDKLEHEIGHALGIRHTGSRDSPMYNEPGFSSEGTQLTVSDVLDILHQLDPNNRGHEQTLDSSAISGGVTVSSPIAR